MRKKMFLVLLVVGFPILMFGLFVSINVSLMKDPTTEHMYAYAIKKGYEEEVMEDMNHDNISNVIWLTDDELAVWSKDRRIVIDPRPRKRYNFRFVRGYEEEMKKELGLPKDFLIQEKGVIQDYGTISFTKQEYNKYKNDKRIRFVEPLTEATGN